ncbi:MAG: hypothetical protein FJ292_10525 [Planctomycetes bacterium]|nr:hypothetical protein [Planctomycetota bacterium]
MTRAQIAEQIRAALTNAQSIETALQPFSLAGRGHEPRVVLSRSLAGMVRSCDLERIHISGFGPKQRFPRRVFERATRLLALAEQHETLRHLQSGFRESSG